jgi:hypothetical protein
MGTQAESSQTELRPLSTWYEVSAHDNSEGGHGSTGMVVGKAKVTGKGAAGRER